MSQEMNLQVLDKLIEKIANLDVMGVPEGQIAKACGLTPGRVSQIMATDRYIEHFASVNSQELEQRRTLAQGFGAIEEEATNVVLLALQNGADADFALRALKVANSANRNPASFAHAGNTLHPQPGHANIKLPTAYIEKLQQMNIGNLSIHLHTDGEVAPAPIEKKVNQLSVSNVKELFKQHLSATRAPLTLDGELLAS